MMLMGIERMTTVMNRSGWETGSTDLPTLHSIINHFCLRSYQESVLSRFFNIVNIWNFKESMQFAIYKVNRYNIKFKLNMKAIHLIMLLVNIIIVSSIRVQRQLIATSRTTEIINFLNRSPLNGGSFQ